MATVLDTLIVKMMPQFDGRGLRDLDRAVTRARARLNSLGDQAIKIGGSAVAVATGFVTAFSREESLISRLAASTGRTVEEIEEKYLEAARSISEETGLGLDKVFEGLLKGLSAGLEGDALTGAVREAALAEAAGIARIDEAVSSATTAYQVFGTDATQALNETARAAQLGEGSAEEYGAALKGLMQSAGNFEGVTTAGLNAVLAASAGMTKSVGVSETQIRSFLTSFTQLSKENTDAAKALDEYTDGTVTFNDLTDTLAREGLPGLIEQLQTITGMDPTRIARLFGSQEAQQFIASIDPARVREFRTEIEASDGTIRSAFLQGAGDVDRQLAQIKQEVLAIAASIGRELKPAIDTGFAVVRDVLDWFQALPDSVQETIAKVLILGSALFGAGIAAKALAFALGGLQGAGRLIGGIGTAASGVGPGLVALLRLIPGIGLLVLLASVVVAAWRPISTFFAGLWNAIAEAFGTGTDASGRSADSVGIVAEAWGRLLDALGPVGDGIRKIGEAWEWLTGLLDFDATAAGESVGEWLARDLAAGIDWITSIVEAWNGLTSTVGAGVRGSWGWLLDDVADPFAWLTDAWAAMVATVEAAPDVWAWLRARVPAPFAWLIEYWAALVAVVTAPVVGVWAWLRTDDPDPFAPVRVAWDRLLGVLTAPVAGVWDFLMVGDDVDPFGWIRDSWDALLAWFASLSLADEGAALVRTVTDGIVSAKDAIVDGLRETFGRVVDLLLPDSDAREGPLSRLTDHGRAIVETIAAGVRSVGDAPLRDALAGGALALGTVTAAAAAPLPVGPAPLAGAVGAPAGAGVVNVGSVTVNVQIDQAGGEIDPVAIGGQVGDEVTRRMRGLAEQADRRILV